MRNSFHFNTHKNNEPFKLKWIFSFLILSILSITIAYSASNTELNISGEAMFRLESDIRLTSCSVDTTVNGGNENYNCQYGKDSLITEVTLPALNSTVTYNVTITNFVDIVMIFNGLTNQNFNNTNMEYIIIEK